MLSEWLKKWCGVCMMVMGSAAVGQTVTPVFSGQQEGVWVAKDF
ncbi:MAG: hypothetical protein RLZ66_1065, partial [Pseudomonadota bacterium]